MDIAILGYGTVGTGTVNVLTKNRELINEDSGEVIRIKRILTRRDRPGDPYEDRIVHDFDLILNDPGIEVVAECMGGLHPAFEYVTRLMESGKSVVTSNKDLVAEYGQELLKTAAAHNVDFYYEACVGGGIPIMRMINECMIQEKIFQIQAVLNGTTNYILTEMEEEGVSYEEALEDAQQLGYAEQDPTSDVEALDAARKLAILCTHAYCIYVPWKKIARTGITKITREDIEIAKSLDYHIKLMARSEMKGKRLFASVEPVLLPEDHPLSSVENVYNRVMMKSNMLDDITIGGKGAGSLPTGSALAADIIWAAINKKQGITTTTYHAYREVDPESVSSMGQCYMLRTKKKAPLPIDGIVSGLRIGKSYAYFTKTVKRQELRDIMSAIQDHGIKVENCMAVADEHLYDLKS